MEKRITKLEVILAAFLLLLPLVLILATGETRTSISNYAYSEQKTLFGMLLSIAAAMFIYNGVIHREKWYNIVLGFSLLGVALTPHLDFPILHYSFAALFFAGGTFVMIIFSSAAQREIKIVAAVFIALAILGHFVGDLYSLLVAEWIGMLPMAVHFAGESLNKID